MKFIKKPVVVNAVQWNGFCDYDERKDPSYYAVGHGERRNVDCGYCGGDAQDHGWIKTLEGGHVVCPGDWIVTGIEGEMYPCKNNIFMATYEPVPAERAED